MFGRSRRRSPNPVLMMGTAALAAKAGARAGANAAAASQQQQMQAQPVMVPQPVQPVTFTTAVPAAVPAPASAWAASAAPAPAPASAPAASTLYHAPQVVTQYPPIAPPTSPPDTAGQHPTWNQQAPTTYYGNPHQQVAPAAHVPLVSIISPDDTKKIRKMQGVNLACSLLQLACAITIICVVGRELALYNFMTLAEGNFVDYYCFAAMPDAQGTCWYAYALASASIFLCFVISVMQCLTMDCCGAGRALEAVFDSMMLIWWTAGTVTLAVRADEANKAGLPFRDARNAVVAMAAISAFMFLVLLVVNIVLIKRLGKAYKAASQQVQQRMTAYLPAGTPMTAYPQQTPGAVAPAPGGPTAMPTIKNADGAV